jgi:hypothetical protein
MRLTIVRALIVLLGLVAVVTGGRSILSGLDGVVEVVARPAIELDNNVRFLSAIWSALGLGLFTCAVDPQRHRSTLRMLLWLVFAGGIGRLVAVKFHGLPATPYIAITASEIFAPLLLLALPGKNVNDGHAD